LEGLYKSEAEKNANDDLFNSMQEKLCESNGGEVNDTLVLTTSVQGVFIWLYFYNNFFEKRWKKISPRENRNIIKK